MQNNTSVYEDCAQCPRLCHANRKQGGTGFCKEEEHLRLASACLHFGEEPPLTVFGGSGTIFVTGCTLRCSFCQNYQISQLGMGRAVSKEEFVQICLLLQKKGAENINIVTGSHQIPILAQFLRAAKDLGLTIPIAWNSSAYECIQSLELLKPVVNIWLPDLKTLSSKMSKNLFAATDYPKVATCAIEWMLKNSPLQIKTVQKGTEKREKMFSGVIVRHLFMPGRIEDSVSVLEWLKSYANGKAYVSLMSQYTPVPFFKGSNLFENRLVNSVEEADLCDFVEAFDFSHIFFQELNPDTSWLPDFARSQPFSNALATPVWHWKTGFLAQ